MQTLFINSLPKSGTNMVSKLVEQAGLRYADLGIASTSVLGRHAFAKALIRGVLPGSEMVRVGLDTSVCVRKGWMLAAISKLRPGMYATGHLPHSDQLAAILAGASVKVIEVIRDPRDVLVSWVKYVEKETWHYANSMLVGKSTEEQVAFILFGGQAPSVYVEGFRSVLRNVEGWLASPDVMVVRFEDLVGERGRGSRERQAVEVKRICEFAGMQDANHAELADALFGGTHTFRNGQIGGWEKALGSMVQEVQRELDPVARAWGYDA